MNLTGNLSKIAERNSNLVEELNKKGASSAEVFSSLGDEVKILAEGKEISVSSGSQDLSSGVRSIWNGKTSFINVNGYNSEASVIAKEASDLAMLGESTPHNKINEESNIESIDQKIDQKIEEMDESVLYEVLENLKSKVYSNPKVTVDKLEVEKGRVDTVISTSNGLVRAKSLNYLTWYVFGMARSGSEVSSFDYDGDFVCTLDSIDEKINDTANRFVESVTSCLFPKTGKSYKGKVLFHPQAVADIVLSFITSNCNGLSHAYDISSWKGKLGELVASKGLNVFEEPNNVKKLQGWKPFDREGFTPESHYLIKNGALNHIAENCFSASKNGTLPTGNSAGGSASSPAVGFSNLTLSLDSGTLLKDQNEIMKELNDGLMIKRFSGNSDSTSGFFSGIAKNSFMIESGEKTNALKEVMIAGNIFELIQNIVAATKEPTLLFDGRTCPYLIIDGLSVTAG